MTWAFEWHDSLSFGIPEIDGQHQELVTLLTRLAETVKNNELSDEVRHSRAMSLMDHIYADLRNHFRYEEALMASIDFEGSAAHQREHLMMVAEMKALIANIDRGRDHVDHQMLAAVKDMLITHIASHDRPFLQAYMAQGGTIPTN